MLTNFKQKNLFISAFLNIRFLYDKFFIIGKLGKMKYEEIRKLLGKFRKL